MGSANENAQKDSLLFADENPPADASGDVRPYPWKLLIVDDDEEIHSMTRLVLSDYTYEGAGLELLSAYSGSEAKQLINDHPDAACVLLDVVMESNTAGLDVVRFIRETANNSCLRIILRTGQPGKAPERQVILDYDINDYKEKTELTSQKLFTAITTAIRSFQHLKDIERQKSEIARKNVRLNEEIARRIVAESNLAKYNRSLETTLEAKKRQLKEALRSLEKAELRLKKPNRLSCLENLSSKATARMEPQTMVVRDNLKTVDVYRNTMTDLIVRYEQLLRILKSHTREFDVSSESLETVKAIDSLTSTVDLPDLLDHYPRIIDESQACIEQIAQAVTDIKTFIQAGAEKIQTLNVNEVVKNALDQVTQATSPGTIVKTDLGQIPDSKGFPNTLQMALEAVIRNAVEAAASTGSVRISTDTDRDGIIVRILDTGKGIPEENLTRVFDPYFTDCQPPHRGIGLFVAKNAVTLHSGSIKIDSRAGQGTCVLISLPLHPETV